MVAQSVQFKPEKLALVPTSFEDTIRPQTIPLALPAELLLHRERLLVLSAH